MLRLWLDDEYSSIVGHRCRNNRKRRSWWFRSRDTATPELTLCVRRQSAWVGPLNATYAVVGYGNAGFNAAYYMASSAPRWSP